MGWEEEAIEEFERLKMQRNKNEEVIQERLRTRQQQAPSRWISLQGAIHGLVIQFNLKAGRNLFQVHGQPTHIVVQREDGVSLEIEWSGDSFRASFRYPKCSGHNREYELRTMPVNGNDVVVWIDRQKNEPQTDEQIAAASIHQLIRCGFAVG